MEPPCSGNEPNIDNCDFLMLKCSHQRNNLNKETVNEETAYRMGRKIFTSSIYSGIDVQNICKEPKKQIPQPNKTSSTSKVANETDTKFSTVLLQLVGKYMIKVFSILRHCSWGNEN